MKISYLICTHNETDTLIRLLKRIINLKNNKDEIIILDDFSDNEITKNILNTFTDNTKNIFLHKHELNKNYSTHKNYGNKECSGDYIFQIDGDECPPENIMGENLNAIIEINPDIELIYVPRINDYRGVTEEHSKHWGWRLTPSPSYENRPVVNWPDFQSRIYKNVPDRIKWDRKLHEKIVGHNKYSFLPAEEEYALYHDKTIEKQLETNYRYNKMFSVEDNMGHKVT